MIDISSSEVRQTIGHIGSGAFIHRFEGVLAATDSVSELNLKTLQPRYARVAIGLGDWEPGNDNADPIDANAQAFQDRGFNHATFEFMKLMQERGVEITASIWDVPDWMVSNPKDENTRLIPPGSQILESSANTATVAAVAAMTPKGVVLHLVNQALKVRVRVTGLPNGDYDLLLTDEKGTGQLSQTITVRDGRASFELARLSIEVLVPHATK